MYRLILIDDEAHIRRGLCTLIPWDEFGIEIIGEADNGQMALDLIKTLHPDIAIADIKMPHMDGIKLLEEVSKLSYKPKFVMLSGFDQFNYVRSAMRLGAQNYLLKPVDADELKSTISELIATLDDEAAKKQQFEESMQALLNNTLNRLLSNRIEVRELREKCQLLDITLRCNCMSIGIVRPLFNNQDITLRWIMFKSLEICRTIFNQYLSAYPVADTSDNIAIIIKNPSQKLNDTELMNILKKCSSAIEKQYEIKCEIALGSIAKTFKDLPSSYQAALRMLDMRLMWGNLNLQPKEITSMQQAVTSALSPDLLTELFSQGQSEELKNHVHLFFHKTLPENHIANLSLVQFHVIELVTCMLQAAHKCYVPESDLARIKSDAYDRIRNSHSLHNLENLVMDIINKLCEQTQQISTGRYSQRVQYTVQYIHRHYDDCNLSLKTMADKLAINSAYLGRQFSQETGEFFSDYLNRVRIDHAKQILATTTMKVADVANRVGFVNVSYFSTIYKKLTGESPAQSRIADN